jgi:hypothetical protein
MASAIPVACERNLSLSVRRRKDMLFGGAAGVDSTAVGPDGAVVVHGSTIAADRNRRRKMAIELDHSTEARVA